MYVNREQQREYQRRWVAKRRADYLDGKVCNKCSDAEGPFEVDHIDPSQKVTNSVWSWTQERREAELAKCQVLCRPCHVKKTAEQRNFGKSPCGTLTSYTSYKCRCAECRANWARYERERRAGKASTGDKAA